MTLIIILSVGGVALGSVGGYMYRKKMIEGKHKEIVEKAEKMLFDAKTKSKELIFEAKIEALKLQDELKKEEQKNQARLNEIEERVMKKESVLDKKNDHVDKVKNDLENKISSIKHIRDEVEGIYKLQSQQLERISSMSKEEARQFLLQKVEEEAKEDIVVQIKKAEEELKAKADEKARWIIADAIVRNASETTAESTATIVNLPSDDLKGRIIGREGRNINTFEQITGVDVIIDDTPNSIVISGFDLVRRYVAKVSLERLIEDGRIHPARIEETVTKVKDEVNSLIKELGDKAVLETGVTPGVSVSTLRRLISICS